MKCPATYCYLLGHSLVVLLLLYWLYWDKPLGILDPRNRFIAEIEIAYLLAFLLSDLMNFTISKSKMYISKQHLSKCGACNSNVPYLYVYSFMCNVVALLLDADTNCFGIEWEGNHVPTLNCRPIAHKQ